MKHALKASIGISGLVALAALLDLVLGIFGSTSAAPFAGQVMMDIMFLIAAGLIGWMGYETLQEQN